MRKSIDNTGFAAPSNHTLGEERRTVAFAELIASIALALCTVVAATVVTVGIARADVGGGVVGNEGSLFVVALLLGLIFIGFGSISVLPPRGRRRH
jgi:hypothetical protein